MHKASIKTDLPATGLPFSWGVTLDHLIFLAGQGPLGPDGKVIEGDIRVQTQETLENFRRVVEAAGSRPQPPPSPDLDPKNPTHLRWMHPEYPDHLTAEPRPHPATGHAGP